MNQMEIVAPDSPNKRSLLSRLMTLAGLFLLILPSLYAQTHVVTGKVISSDDNQPLPGVNIFVKGSSANGTVTNSDGNYSISIPYDSAELIYSFVGFGTHTEKAGARTLINVTLMPDVTTLDEIVVTGYGTQVQKDLTGAVTSVKERDFNKGNFVSPDQLIQGRVAGVQITNSSGQPGVAATIKIRGNSVLTGTGQPLFVVDGVPLSGTTARPNTTDPAGTSPAGNPLNFLNPADIVSMDVLKDASAAAIYGSRAAYGVVLITTKKAVTGEPGIDFAFSAGLSTIQNKIKVLDAAQFRDALTYYGAPSSNDLGTSSDGLSSILRTGKQQNYSIGISGGSANGKYRLSLGYFDQEGIIAKSEIKKYNVNFAGNFKFLESKRLGMDVNITASQYNEDLPFIRNDGGMMGAALGWNPTDSLHHANGSLKIITDPNRSQNPLVTSQYYNDNSKLTTILASVAPRYEFTDWLEFKMQASINYGSGVRRNSFGQEMDVQQHLGGASINNNENSTSQFTNTLTFHKDIISNLNLTAIAGFEYMNFTAKGSSINLSGPVDSNGNPIGFGSFGLDYTNYIQYSNASTRQVSSFINPSSELQSYFGRAAANYKGRYLLTATFRADGSTKFGANNKYGYFPSFSAGWVVSEEDFFKAGFIDFFKVRIGWGKTGNQEFPSGSAVALYSFTGPGAIGQSNSPNPNLKWQADEQFNAGVDFTILNNRISGSVDYFQKITTDLLYPSYPIQPAPTGTVATWINLDGKIRNKGLEAAIKATLIDHHAFGWDFGINATFLQNNVTDLTAPILTGYLVGRGMSGVTVQEIRNGSPMNSFYTRKFLGIDPATGLSLYQDNGNTFYNAGNPNPSTLLGINSTFRLNKFSLTINMYGAFGQSIYNNTLNSTLIIGNLIGGNNIATSVYQNPVKESLYNTTDPSSRFIERGDYLKLSNATLNYNFGNVGKTFKQARVYVTGQNLLTFTSYSGFNPEINIDRSVNNVPSLGIDHEAYPTARTIILGISFSL